MTEREPKLGAPSRQLHMPALMAFEERAGEAKERAFPIGTTAYKHPRPPHIHGARRWGQPQQH